MKKVPRIEFVSDLREARKSRQELAKMIEEHLSRKFGKVRLFRRYFFPVSLLTLKVNGDDFVVAVGKEKWHGYHEEGWRVAIDPLECPFPSRLSRDEEKKYAQGLMLISDDIHSMVTETLGVARLRWFFEGWDVSKPGARAPTELPWHA